MLKDLFGRRFEYLRLSVTDRCNFRCNYCLPDGDVCKTSDAYLSLDEMRTLVKAFANVGTKKIRITGGEPSLRRDLTSVIETVSSVEGIQQCVMTTNGYRLFDNVSEWKQAGLDGINVSIDSFDPRQFKAITGSDKLTSILDGLDKALQLNLAVKVNAVLLKQFNCFELSSMLDWLRDTPVSLRFIELMQTGDNQAFFKANHVSGQGIKDKLLEQGWLPVVKSSTAGPAQEFWHQDYAGRVGLIMPYSKDFCASCNRLRVSALGKLHLCLFAEQGIDLREVIQTGDTTEVESTLRALLTNKQASHWLDSGYTGATKNLAMLGG